MKKLITFSVAGIMILTLAAKEAGVRVNLTASAPRGIWQVHNTNEIKRGMLVSVCPPESEAVSIMKAKNLINPGECPATEVEPLLKAIGAIPGDTVTIRNGNTVTVNGEPVPNSLAIGNIRWKEGTYKVKPGEVWIFSTYVPNSFDSRYFGPVKIGNINGEAFPLVIDGKVADMKRGIKND